MRHLKLISPLIFIFSMQFATELVAQPTFLWPNASTYNKNTDKYYITNYKGQNVISLDAAGNKVEVAKNLTAPNNLLFASLPIGDGYIILDSNEIKGYDSGWNYYASFTTPGAIKMQDAVFDATNSVLYITDVIRGVIYKTTFGSAPFYFPSTSVFSSPHRRPSAMVLQAVKNRILYVEDTIGGNLMAMDLSTGNTSLVKSLNMDNLVGLAEDGQGNLYLSSQGLKGIYQLNKYYSGSPVKLYSEPKPGDILVNTLKDQWVYSCLICGTVFTPPLHLFGPGLEIAGCPGDSFFCYKNYLHRNIGTFDKGNQFIMEMSNQAGQFVTPRQLVKINDTLIPPTMDGIIPKGLPSGPGYKVRWRSTKPAVISIPEQMTIFATPKGSVAISDTVQACAGNKITLGAGNVKDTTLLYAWTPKNEVDSSQNALVQCMADKNKWIYLTIRNSDGCILNDSAFIKPVSVPNAGNLTDTVQACQGQSAMLGGKPLSGIVYSWSPGNLLDDSTSANPVFKTPYATKFKVTVTAAGGCFSKDSQFVNLNPLPTFKIVSDSSKICAGGSGINSIIPDNKPYKAYWIGESNDTTQGDNLGYASGTPGQARRWTAYYVHTQSGCISNRNFVSETFAKLNPKLSILTNELAVNIPLQNLKWYRNDTAIAGGDTLKNPKPGLYHACGFSNGVCYECTNSYLVVPKSNNVQSMNLNCTFYPNPADEILYLSCTNTGADIFWQINSMAGQKLAAGKGSIISFAGLNQGVYLVKINNIQTIKIVKK